MKNMYLVVGIFFQHKLANRVHTIFHGVLKKNGNQFEGATFDRYGEAILQSIEFGKESEGRTLQFEKVYHHLPSIAVPYTLKEQKVGYWEGSYQLNGRYETVKLFLTSIDEQEFFEFPDEVMEKLRT